MLSSGAVGDNMSAGMLSTSVKALWLVKSLGLKCGASYAATGFRPACMQMCACMCSLCVSAEWWGILDKVQNLHLVSAL